VSAWTGSELDAIENTDELDIATLRADDLFVRSANGRDPA
jgi:hypothetical protein